MREILLTFQSIQTYRDFLSSFLKMSMSYVSYLAIHYFQLYNKRMGAPVLFYKEYKTAKYFSTFLNKEVPIEFSKVVGKSILDNPRECYNGKMHHMHTYNTKFYDLITVCRIHCVNTSFISDLAFIRPRNLKSPHVVKYKTLLFEL